MNVKLIRPYKNHPKGTVLVSVSQGIFDELAKLKVIEVEPKKSKKKAITKPKRNKMVSTPDWLSPVAKRDETKRAVEKPPLPNVRTK